MLSLRDHQIEMERLRDAAGRVEHERLVRLAMGTPNSWLANSYRRLLVRLGDRLVSWGAALQSQQIPEQGTRVFAR